MREVLAAPLAPGTAVYITWLPGDSPALRLEAAKALRGAGLRPVPHIAARYLEDADAVHDLLGRLSHEAGVDQILLIGGDVERPRGPFRSGLDLLDAVPLEAFGIRRVGLPAYPEGHPRIPGSVLERALSAKVARLRASGIVPYVVTQFCFEAAPVLAWLTRFRTRGCDVPVHLGLAGPARISTLLKFAATCGIGASLRALRRNAGLTRILTEAGPEPILRAIAADPRRAEVTRLHVFTFGGIARSASWLRDIADGETVAA